MVGDNCWIDASRQNSYMDVCYHKYRATNDGSATYDYYALDMFTTFATTGFGLETGDPWIKAQPASSSPAATWYDWRPRSDQTQRDERELEFTVAVRVAQGKVPTWTFDWYEHVQFASCPT